METKFCKRCQENKTIDCYNKSTTRKSGLHPWCRICTNAYRKINGFNKYSRHSQASINYQRAYRKTKKYRDFEIPYRNAYNRSFAGLATKMLTSAKGRAKKRGLIFTITREWVIEHLMPMKCEATGSPLTLETDNTVQHTAFKPSIDRIDNCKGYTTDNSRIVCVIFNKAKSDYTDENVFTMAQNMVEWLKNK